MRRRFQGLSLEQQRKMKKKRKKRVVGRRESAISGTFNTSVSRTPSSVSAAAWKNPFGLQVHEYSLECCNTYSCTLQVCSGICV